MSVKGEAQGILELGHTPREGPASHQNGSMFQIPNKLGVN